MKLIFLLVFTFLLPGCSDATGATNALEDAGYKNITITGFKIFGCDKNDTFSTGFNAIGITGRNVHGVVCSGFMKGSTIRIL
jgi:hypothetical protein